MLAEQIADLLKTSRKALGLSQKELARRARVSTRLWAELERGERPNVSLATALRMLGEVGVTVRLTDPYGITKELRDPGAAAIARAARAAVRRATWPGRQIRLEQEGASDPASARGHQRLSAVGVVSEQAFAVARGKTPQAPRASGNPIRSSTRSRASTHR